MTSTFPQGAFEEYVRLGPQRSYQAIAAHFGVSKRAVTKCAQREDWPARLDAIAEKAKQKTDESLVDVLGEMNTRHLRTCKVIQAKALETLRSMPLNTALAAVKALEMAMKHERLIHGEPTDRTANSVEELVRREYQQWLQPVPDEDDEDESEDEVDRNGEQDGHEGDDQDEQYDENDDHPADDPNDEETDHEP